MSSLIHSSIGITVMALTGLLIGWRMRDGVVHGVAAFALLLLFGFAMIWIGIWVGSMLRSVEAVNGLHVHGDVPADVHRQHVRARPTKMPTWLRLVAEWNPVSALTQATRELWGNGPRRAAPTRPGRCSTPRLVTVVWAMLITAVFAPLALAAFRRRSRD